jgi:hypothetical protein
MTDRERRQRAVSLTGADVHRSRSVISGRPIRAFEPLEHVTVPWPAQQALT